MIERITTIKRIQRAAIERSPRVRRCPLHRRYMSSSLMIRHNRAVCVYGGQFEFRKACSSIAGVQYGSKARVSDSRNGEAPSVT